MTDKEQLKQEIGTLSPDARATIWYLLEAVLTIMNDQIHDRPALKRHFKEQQELFLE